MSEGGDDPPLPAKVEDFFPGGSRFSDARIQPRFGEGASDPKFDRLAGEEFRMAQFHRDMQQAFDADRGAGFLITQTGQRLAATATDAHDLARLVRREFSSRLLQNDRDAEKLADVAFRAFAKRHGMASSDLPWMMTRTIGDEYREMVRTNQRKEVAARARKMEQDPIFRARQEWREQVEASVRESGLPYEFVEAVLLEYQAAGGPRHPGVIDPRSSPILQLRGEQLRAAKMIDFMTGGAAGSLGQAVAGIGWEGQQLSVGERILEAAFGIMSVMPGGGLAGDIAAGAKLGAAALKSIVTGGRLLARAAMSSGVAARALLRLLGRLRHVDPKGVLDLLKRMREARAAKKQLRLTDGEARLMREIDQAFAEHAGKAGKAAKLATPTARAFMFLNRLQPLVLGKLLGRKWGTPAAKMGKKALQEAEDIAADLAERVRRHWDAALPAGEASALGACQKVFAKLQQAKPANPNGFVRDKLYDAWRKRAMRRIGSDRQLVEDLERHAGIVVGQNKLTRNWSMHIRTKGPKAAREQTHVDFDHALVRHSDAVADATRFKDARPLISTIDGKNLQFMTARENRTFIEELRAAAKEAEDAPGL